MESRSRKDPADTTGSHPIEKWQKLIATTCDTTSGALLFTDLLDYELFRHVEWQQGYAIRSVVLPEDEIGDRNDFATTVFGSPLKEERDADIRQKRYLERMIQRR